MRLLYEQASAGLVPDLVMLDLELPGDSGIAILKKLRAGCLKSIPVVMLTASESLLDRDEAMALGALAFVTKPANLAEFAGIGEIAKKFIARD